MAIAITTLDQLKIEATKDGGLNAFVELAGGMARSSKLMSRGEDDSWFILHEIDDTEAEYPTTDAMLAAEPTIAEALGCGGLFAHWID
jgi:hypothetical protein